MMRRIEEPASPVFVIGNMRSGKTLLRRLMQAVWPQIALLTDDDCESRTYWQFHGLHIGARATGTYCHPAYGWQVTQTVREAIQRHIEERSRNGHLVVNDNAHLMNKVGFVAESLPQCRFIHVVRDVMGLVAYAKSGFQRGNISNESYPAFVHYWPECELPCWYTLKNDVEWHLPTSGGLRRAVREMCCRLQIRDQQTDRSPSLKYEHVGLRAFLKEHPDLSRYYPGRGFARLPEAWVRQNHGVLMQFKCVAPERVMHVTYAELVLNPRHVLERVMRFCGVTHCEYNAIPERLDEGELATWQQHLTRDEQTLVRSVVAEHAEEYRSLCIACGQPSLLEGVVSGRSGEESREGMRGHA